MLKETHWDQHHDHESSGGNQGISFAIPVNMARSVMDQMVEYGDVQRGLLGISMQELTESMAKVSGLIPRKVSWWVTSRLKALEAGR